MGSAVWQDTTDNVFMDTDDNVFIEGVFVIVSSHYFLVSMFIDNRQLKFDIDNREVVLIN